MNMTVKISFKRSAQLGLATFLAALVAPAQAQMTPITTPLMAGKHYVAGSVGCSVNPDGVTGQCVYTMAPGSDWCISEAHLWVGLTTPTKGAPGQFPFSAMTTCATRMTVPFNLSQVGVPTCALGAPGYVFAAHAVLHSQTYGNQTGWGQGVALPVRGGGWSMSFASACIVPA